MKYSNNQNASEVIEKLRRKMKFEEAIKKEQQAQDIEAAMGLINKNPNKESDITNSRASRTTTTIDPNEVDEDGNFSLKRDFDQEEKELKAFEAVKKTTIQSDLLSGENTEIFYDADDNGIEQFNKDNRINKGRIDREISVEKINKAISVIREMEKEYKDELEKEKLVSAEKKQTNEKNTKLKLILGMATAIVIGAAIFSGNPILIGIASIAVGYYTIKALAKGIVKSIKIHKERQKINELKKKSEEKIQFLDKKIEILKIDAVTNKNEIIKTEKELQEVIKEHLKAKKIRKAKASKMIKIALFGIALSALGMIFAPILAPIALPIMGLSVMLLAIGMTEHRAASKNISFGTEAKHVAQITGHVGKQIGIGAAKATVWTTKTIAGAAKWGYNKTQNLAIAIANKTDGIDKNNRNTEYSTDTTKYTTSSIEETRSCSHQKKSYSQKLNHRSSLLLERESLSNSKNKGKSRSCILGYKEYTRTKTRIELTLFL